MSIRNIYVEEDKKILNSISQDVEIKDGKIVNAEYVSKLINDMKLALTETNGVGIAAPQVGVNLNIFLMHVSSEAAESASRSRSEAVQEVPLKIVINPSYVIDVPSSINRCVEGCLSVPGNIGIVERPNFIMVNYIDENGINRSEYMNGFTARVFLHEYDHLIGKTYLDRVKDGDNYTQSEWLEIVNKAKDTKDFDWFVHNGIKIDLESVLKDDEKLFDLRIDFNPETRNRTFEVIVNINNDTIQLINKYGKINYFVEGSQKYINLLTMLDMDKILKDYLNKNNDLKLSIVLKDNKYYSDHMELINSDFKDGDQKLLRADSNLVGLFIKIIMPYCADDIFGDDKPLFNQ